MLYRELSGTGLCTGLGKLRGNFGGGISSSFISMNDDEVFCCIIKGGEDVLFDMIKGGEALSWVECTYGGDVLSLGERQNPGESGLSFTRGLW